MSLVDIQEPQLSEPICQRILFNMNRIKWKMLNVEGS